MKKNLISKSIIIIFMISVVISPIVAQSVDNSSEYSEELNTKENITDFYDEESSEVQSSKNSNSKKKKSFNPFEGMFTAKQASYKFYETIPLSTGTIGYTIKHKTSDVFVDPKTEKAGIQVHYQSCWFDFLFDYNNIALISDCLEKYLNDFENHNLIKNKTMKTRKIYTAKGKCRVEWGTIKAMMNNYGDTNFHVGYEFKNNSPYFCIIIKDTNNIAPDLGSNVAEKSVEVQLYFTKAEAQRFLEVLGRDRVSKELNKNVFVEDEY